MPDITAERIAEIMEPVFQAVLPVAAEVSRGCRGCRDLANNPMCHAMLCEAAMVRWLADERIAVEVVRSDGWDVVLAPEGIGYHGGTLLEALAAGVLAVAQQEAAP